MVTYMPAKEQDIAELRKLWLSCFDEIEAAADCVFAHIFKLAHVYKATLDGTAIAAVYLADCKLCGRQAHYLLGAATLPEYRRRGVMSGLIRFALADAKSRGDCFSVLLPANEGLYSFYRKLGYESRCTADTAELTRRELWDMPEAQLNRLDNALEWSGDFVGFAAEYYGCYGCRELRSDRALCLYETEDDAAHVFYAAYQDIRDLNSLLRRIDAQRFVVTGKSGSLPHALTERRGMLKPLNGEIPPDNVYIGLTLS